MTKKTYGLLAGVAALGAWYWTRYRSQHAEPALDRGTVIYDNTPTATNLSQEGIV